MNKMFFALLVTGIFLSTPVLSDHHRGNKEEAVELVNKFVAYYKEKGSKEALAEVQNEKGLFRKKDLYIFVVRSTGDDEAIILAHAVNPALIGRNVINMRDVDGVSFFLEFRKPFLSEEGEGWVSYKWPHPVTRKIEEKLTFIKKIDDTTYAGCGVSEE